MLDNDAIGAAALAAMESAPAAEPRKRRQPRKVRGIFERPKGSGIWWVRYADASGREHREKAGTRAAAVQLYQARKTAILEGRKLPAKLRGAAVPTLAEFAQRFMDAIQLHCAAKPRTVEFYAQQLRYLLNFEPLAHAKLSAIDEALIEAFAQHRAATVGPVTVNRGLATLRRALRLAQQWQVIDRVPGIRLLPGENRREYILPREQEAAYLAACPQPLRDAAMLMLETGLRAGEGLRLTWEDVSLQGTGYVRMRDGKSRYARRAVALTARVRAMLAERRKQAQAERVFAEFAARRERTLVNDLYHQHVRVRRALGLPQAFVIHSLRHTFCTGWAKPGRRRF